jgi:hypothetical protein
LSRIRGDLENIEDPGRASPYSGDRDEPPHIHCERDANVAKFWLDPVRLEDSGGSGAAELLRIERIVLARREESERAWHDYFDD